MPARVLVGSLAILAAAAVLAAGFLPRIVHDGPGFAYRFIDFDAPARVWLAGLAFSLGHAALLGVPGLILLRRWGPLAAGILLGTAAYGALEAQFSLFSVSGPFRIGIAVWVELFAGVIVLATTIAVMVRRPRDPRAGAARGVPSPGGGDGPGLS